MICRISNTSPRKYKLRLVVQQLNSNLYGSWKIILPPRIDRSLYLKDLYAISKLWMKYEFILWQIFIKIFEQFQIVLPNGDVRRQIQKVWPKV